jgi:hypothetical protein
MDHDFDGALESCEQVLTSARWPGIMDLTWNIADQILEASLRMHAVTRAQGVLG